MFRTEVYFTPNIIYSIILFGEDMSVEDLKCIDCGKEFTKYQHNQKRCYECIAKTDPRFKSRPKKQCPTCAKVFRPRTIRHTYCTDACAKKSWEKGYFKRTYGLSLDEYQDMFERSEHKCNICGSEGFRINSKAKNTLCVDHDHETGKIRGLLCHNCNRALGLLQDDTTLLEKAIKYLEGSETIP